MTADELDLDTATSIETNRDFYAHFKNLSPRKIYLNKLSGRWSYDC